MSSVPPLRFYPQSNDKDFIESQWKAYMGSFTSLPLLEAYAVYVRPGSGGKRWTQEELVWLNKINELTHAGENPFLFRMMPPKTSQ